eukprot:12780753-Alexandrium_andersonii.AAC.1
MSAHKSAVSSYRIDAEATESPTFHAATEQTPCSHGANISWWDCDQGGQPVAWPGCPHAPA